MSVDDRERALSRAADIGLDYAPDVVETLTSLPETVRLRTID